MPQAANLPSASPVASPASRAAIRVENLTHRYPAPSGRRAKSASPGSPASGPPRAALDNVSLEVRPGEIFGILGPNGGGKSTLFRILSTMLRPSAGQVRIFGHDLLTEPDMIRQQLGVVFQSPSLDIKLTAYENLLHQGHLYGLRGPDLESRITDALDRVSLNDRRTERVERFSGGMRRRVELAKALLHHPRLLLLDEPATGLDPGARREVWTQLERLRSQQGVTIALTTHLMEEGDRCDRLAILATGQLRAVDTPNNLKARIGGDVVMVEVESSAAQAGSGQDPVVAMAAAVTQRYGPWRDGATPTVVDGKVRIERDHGPSFVATLAGDFPGQIRSITVGRPTLEHVFMQLTGQALGQDDDAGEPPRPAGRSH